MKEQERRKTDGIGYRVMFGLAVGIIGTLFSLVLVMSAGKVTDQDTRIGKQEATVAEIRTSQATLVVEIKNLLLGQFEMKEALKELSKELRDRNPKPK